MFTTNGFRVVFFLFSFKNRNENNNKKMRKEENKIRKAQPFRIRSTLKIKFAWLYNIQVYLSSNLVVFVQAFVYNANDTFRFHRQTEILCAFSFVCCCTWKWNRYHLICTCIEEYENKSGFAPCSESAVFSKYIFPASSPNKNENRIWGMRHRGVESSLVLRPKLKYAQKLKVHSARCTFSIQTQFNHIFLFIFFFVWWGLSRYIAHTMHSAQCAWARSWILK